jgi:hypothetical protein
MTLPCLSPAHFGPRRINLIVFAVGVSVVISGGFARMLENQVLTGKHTGGTACATSTLGFV